MRNRGSAWAGVRGWLALAVALGGMTFAPGSARAQGDLREDHFEDVFTPGLHSTGAAGMRRDLHENPFEEAFGPRVVRGQDATGYALPDTLVPTPLGSTRPEETWFVFATYAQYEQTMPLDNQVVAGRGFLDIDGTVTGTPFTFHGSNRLALQTKQVTGPKSQQPGFRLGFGYRFADGSTLEYNWLYLSTVRYSALATPLPFDLNIRGDLADSFLFSPVVNFPLDFSGPGNDVNGNPAFGIWNAADLMTIDFTQRNQTHEVIYRMPPIIDTLEFRTYAFVGPRFVWFWERFRWRTFDLAEDGSSGDLFNAFYTNIISNRMYGLKIGMGNDWYMGNGFSCSTDCFVTPMINIVKKRAKYERGDRNVGPERKRSDTDYTLVPELGVSVNLNWFPYEAIQVRAGYNFMAYFNTVTSEEPIDFDYSAVNPEYDRQFRFLRGFEFGISLSF